MAKEEIFARGKLFELVHIEQPNGRVFEIARRAPGVRLIVSDAKQRILLTKEFRHELNDWDFRLPGGKVFDSLEEFDKFRASGKDITEAALIKARAEGREEAGIDIQTLELYQKSTLGATVEWDLFIFRVNKWRQAEQELEEGENIEVSWYDANQVESMILSGKMQEERVALALLRWLKR